MPTPRRRPNATAPASLASAPLAPAPQQLPTLPELLAMQADVHQDLSAFRKDVKTQFGAAARRMDALAQALDRERSARVTREQDEARKRLMAETRDKVMRSIARQQLNEAHERRRQQALWTPILLLITGECLTILGARLSSAPLVGVTIIAGSVLAVAVAALAFGAIHRRNGHGLPVLDAGEDDTDGGTGTGASSGGRGPTWLP